MISSCWDPEDSRRVPRARDEAEMRIGVENLEVVQICKKSGRGQTQADGKVQVSRTLILY